MTIPSHCGCCLRKPDASGFYSVPGLDGWACWTCYRHTFDLNLLQRAIYQSEIRKPTCKCEVDAMYTAQGAG